MDPNSAWRTGPLNRY